MASILLQTADGTPVMGYSLQPGESVEIFMSLLDDVGAPLDLTGATLELRLYTFPAHTLAWGTTLSGLHFTIASSATANWTYGSYQAELWVQYPQQPIRALPAGFFPVFVGPLGTPVNLHYKDAQPLPAPIAGVSVGVLDATTLRPYTFGLSDSNGLVALWLPPNHNYEIRSFKQGVNFGGPSLISVVTPPPSQAPSNEFDVVGTVASGFGLPLDPRLCRCVGRFLGLNNKPMVNRMVRISSQADLMLRSPKIVDGNAIAVSALELRTDREGFVVVDLLRTGEYWISFTGEEDDSWNFKVPNVATVNLIDLIHPRPVALSWDSVTNRSLSLSLSSPPVLVGMTLTFSDYETKTVDIPTWLEFVNLNPDVVSARFGGGFMEFQPLALGQATLQVKMRSNLTPRRVPDYSIDNADLTVTVLP